MSADIALPAAKPAILTLWSAQVAAMDRVLHSPRVTVDARKMALLMLGALKSEIESMISETDEAWTSPGNSTGTVASVIDHDWDRIIAAHKFQGVV